MDNSIKIGVVGDGPIGNIIIAKLLIEHWRNKNNNNKTIEIMHHRSARVEQKGYSRRHILFITEELVNELEKNVLDCQQCLRDNANSQILTENPIEQGNKLLFSIRVLEEILLQLIDNSNKSKMCNENSNCIFTTVPQPKDMSKTYYSDLNYDYLFFAIGSNAGHIRGPYFYGINDKTKYSSNIKISCTETIPIVVFYSKLGNVSSPTDDPHSIHEEDKNSIIYMISKDELQKYHIDIYELEKLVNIIYTFSDYYNLFVEYYQTICTNLTDATNCARFIHLIPKDNLSLNGYLNLFNDYKTKVETIIQSIKLLFEDEHIYNAYLEFIKNKSLRSHPINDDILSVYQNIIKNDSSISDLLKKYEKFIQNALMNSSNNHIDGDLKKYDTTKWYPVYENNTFLVNVVAQSLNSYGIYDDKLVYAKKDAKNNKTNIFLVGDMANAYSPGISVEIGINFVNYIIPLFYNFYINEIKTILNCNQLNIVEILNDLLRPKYNTLLNKKIDPSEYKPTNDADKTKTLKELIENIKHKYENYESLCDDNDIFLTYYNIVSLVQFVKNVDLIIKDKKIIGISKIFKPSNYKILTYANEYNEYNEYNELERF